VSNSFFIIIPSTRLCLLSKLSLLESSFTQLYTHHHYRVAILLSSATDQSQFLLSATSSSPPPSINIVLVASGESRFLLRPHLGFTPFPHTHTHTTASMSLHTHTIVITNMRIQGHVCQGYRHRDRSTFSSLADVTLSLIIHSYPFEPFSFNQRPSLYISCTTIYYTPITTYPPPPPNPPPPCPDCIILIITVS